MIKGHSSWSEQDRQAGMQEVLGKSKAFGVSNSLAETAGSTVGYPELREAAAAAVEGVTHANRPRKIFDIALYRSLRYSMAGGVFCHTAGYRSHFRALYDGLRLTRTLKED